MEDLSGKALGPFDVQRRIGQGAMGAVYVGVHRSNGKRAALKVMTPPNPEAAAKLAARFEREIKLLSKFRHPNIVRFYGASEDQGVRYYAMEFVEGHSLEDVLDKEGVLPLSRAVAYGIQICEALQEMHATGVVHRDLKPANVLITPDHKVKLTDFGIAKDTSSFNEARLTAADHTVGTIAYMSPEQLAGQELTRKSDLFALGILLYRMVTGELPFSGETMFEYMKRRQAGTFTIPTMLNRDLPLEVDGLLGELLSINPDDRPRDAYVVMQRLMDIAKGVKEGTLSRSRPKTPGSTVANKRGGLTTLWSTMFGTREAKTKKKSSKKSEAEQPAGSLFESPWVLAAAMVLVIAFAVYMFWPPGPAEVFAQGVAVMEKTDVTLDEMNRADRDYFQPILEKDPQSPFGPQIAQYRDQIAMKKAAGKANLALVSNKTDPDATEAELQYIEALRLKEIRKDTVNAEDRFRAIARVFADDPAAKPWVELARKQLEQAATFADDDQRKAAKRRSVEAALERARALRQEGKLREALDEFASIEDLYSEDAEVADLVWKGGTEFLTPEDLFLRGAKLMKSDSLDDWRRAFKQYFEPMAAKDSQHRYVQEVGEFRVQLARREASDKAELDLKIGIPHDASEAEGLYVAALYVESLGDDLSAHDQWVRLVGRFEDDKDAAPWIELAKTRIQAVPEWSGEKDRTSVKQERAAKAVETLKQQIRENPDLARWRPWVKKVYESDNDTGSFADQLDEDSSEAE